ncbi:MAG TPA: outer membrane protein transport protein [Kofleriaceae bacterium]|nr:outer membrane protein transport protein [Kofleriaceae bacterium]
MKLRALTFTVLGIAGTASAGGLLLPGAGAVSSSRAGASVVAADDAEAISLNPAGIAHSSGTVITIGIAAIDYFMSMQRNGDYPLISQESTTYAGTRFPVVTNKVDPPLGIGSFQPVPMIGIVSDLGGRVPHLHVGFGLYAPNAYPFRDMTNVDGHEYQFNSDYNLPPPPNRYDIMKEQAAVILPSIDVAYSILPQLDVGARFSAGFATLKSSVAVWGLQNDEEWIKQDGMFSVDASDSFIPTGALGANYRIDDHIEVGANYTLPIIIHAKGNADPQNGPAVLIGTEPVAVTPVDDSVARCAKGGTPTSLKACVDLEIPMTAQVGGRYKFLDQKGALKGDVELDVGWEHWGASCDYTKDPNCLDPSDFRVVVDGRVGTQMDPDGLAFKDTLIQHGFQDVYDVRLGGSWSFPLGDNAIIARGGVSYDTAAAKPGWERADLDGAARTMLAGGASYQMAKLRFDAGFGVILEGTRSTTRDCLPTGAIGSQGCAPDGSEQPPNLRQGPDPINPILGSGAGGQPDTQAEHPVNEGTYKSHYLFIMLGASYKF